MLNRLLTLDLKLLVKEVVGWKWLQHENILPFLGVMLAPSPISIASERMENGNIMDFVKTHQDYNRLRLVSGGGVSSFHRIDHSNSLQVQRLGWNTYTSTILSTETSKG